LKVTLFGIKKCGRGIKLDFLNVASDISERKIAENEVIAGKSGFEFCGAMTMIGKLHGDPLQLM